MQSHENVRARVFSGVAWESSTKLGIQVFAWVATIFVARILTPSDYGLIAIAGIYTLLIQIFAEAGLTSGVVTARTVTREELRGVFWFNLYAAFATYAVLYAVAPFIAGWYGIAELTDILRVAGLAVFVIVGRVIPMAIVQRELDYRFRALAEFAGMTVQSAGILALALAGFGAWSLVYATLVGQAVITACFLTRLRWYGPPTVDLRPVRSLLAFGARLTAQRTINFGIGMSDMFVVSVLLGQRPAGLFMIAQNFANTPLDKLGSIVNRVSFPAVAHLQEDAERVRRYFLNSHFWLVAVCTPLALGGALVATDLVPLVLTEKWTDAGLIFALLCAANVFRLSGMLMPPVLEGLRHARFLVKYAALNAVVLVPAFVIGGHLAGVVGVAAAWLVVSPLLWAVLARFTLRKLGLSFGEFLGSIGSVLAALAVMAGLVLAVGEWLEDVSTAARLGVEIAVGGVAYGVTLAILSPRQRRSELREMLASVGVRRRGGPALNA